MWAEWLHSLFSVECMSRSWGRFKPRLRNQSIFSGDSSNDTWQFLHRFPSCCGFGSWNLRLFSNLHRSCRSVLVDFGLGIAADLVRFERLLEIDQKELLREWKCRSFFLELDGVPCGEEWCELLLVPAQTNLVHTCADGYVHRSSPVDELRF